MPGSSVTAVTWNCQKTNFYKDSPLSGKGALGPALYALTGDSGIDILFLQEIPLDLRDMDQDKIENLFSNKFHAVVPTMVNNQSHSSECKCLLLVRNTIGRSRSTRFKKSHLKSGATGAFRYPAIGSFSIKCQSKWFPMILGSVHSTSGGGGTSNSYDIIDNLQETIRSGVILLGGDFNSSAVRIQRPKDDTHAGSNGFSKLDGFYIDLAQDEELYSFDAIDCSPHKSFTLTHDGTDRDKTGCFYAGKKVSDHRPVLFEFSLDESGSDMDSDPESDIDVDVPPSPKRQRFDS